MDKSAQKRNVLDWVKEHTNISGIAAERFFNPEFQRVMESLRAHDDAIRSVVSGEAIGEADPGNDPVSLKDLLKLAKSNLNRREYMSAVSDLGRFHQKVYDVTKLISEINLDVDKIHQDFLFKDLSDEKKQYLQDLKKRLARSNYNYFIKEAGIMDFLANIGTKRGRALAMWEKRYPKQIGKLKKDTASLLQKSEGLLSVILSALKEMSNARSGRHVDNYVKSAQKIIKAYQSYDKTFKEYYNSNVKEFLEKQEFMAPAKEVKDVKELEKQEIPVEEKVELFPRTPTTYKPVYPSVEPDPNTIPADPPVHESEVEKSEEFPSDLLAKELMEKINQPGQIGSPKTPRKLLNIEEEPRDTDVDQEEEAYDTEINLHRTTPGLGGKNPNDIKVSHQKFMDTLMILANEDISLLHSHIIRYAKLIQEKDTETSIKLFKIAKDIQG